MNLENIQPVVLQLLLQSGGIVVAIYALYIIRKMANGQTDRMVKALENNTAVMTEVKDSIANLKDLVVMRK